MKKSGAPGLFWWIAVIIGIVGILEFLGVLNLGRLINFDFSAFWIEVIALGVLALASLFRS